MINIGFSTILNRSYDRIITRAQFWPLSIGLTENPADLWRFPVEPLISISGGNKIVKRNVAKQKHRGSIKERWAQEDYKITISGQFEGRDLKTYPKEDVEKLRSFLEHDQALFVTNELFNQLNINWVVIESFSLPFSKGENIQHFTINCLSDDQYDLFIELNHQ